jgi:hypothetical protein
MRKHRRIRPNAIKVGQRVFMPFGDRKVPVRILEDRGEIGVGGRRIWRVQRIRRAEDEHEPEAFEIAEEDLVAAK